MANAEQLFLYILETYILNKEKISLLVEEDILVLNN